MSEGNYYIFYDILDKKKFVKTIINKIEGILLDNIYNMSGGDRYITIHEKLYNGGNLIELLTEAYEQMKRFQLKLDGILKILRPTRNISEQLNEKIKLIIETRNKYSDIVHKLNKIIQTYFYNFSDKPNVDLDKDVNLFIKSEEAKWENIISIYMNFISNYKSILETIKGQNNLIATIEIVNKNIDDNVTEFNEFIELLVSTKIKLGTALGEFNSLVDIQYNKSDIKLTNEIENIIDVSRRSLYISSIKFTDIPQLIKPGNIGVLRSIIEGSISELTAATTFDLNLSLPEIENRVMRVNYGGSINNTFETKIFYQSGGIGIENLNNTIQKLSGFGIQLQNVNLIMGDIRKLYNYYIQLKIRMNYFILYIMMIGTNINKYDFVYYKFINRLTLDYYNKILMEINRRIIIGQRDKYIEYFDKYHYFTIKRLIKFCNFIISEVGDSDVVSINECTGKIRDTFIIFNNFKDILDNYLNI